MYNILFNGSTEAKHIFILAHGAGSPMDSNFMNALALNMASDNLLVIRFEFSYMQKRRQGIKLFPEKLEKLKIQIELLEQEFLTIYIKNLAKKN